MNAILSWLQDAVADEEQDAPGAKLLSVLVGLREHAASHQSPDGCMDCRCRLQLNVLVEDRAVLGEEEDFSGY